MTDQVTEEVINDPSNETHDEVVPKKAYDEVSADMVKYKQGMRDLQDQVKSYEQRVKQAENQKLEQKEEYKTLYQQTKQELETARKDKDELLNAFETEKKFEQIKRAAAKVGLRDEALDDLEMLDTSGVIVEKTDQGRINIIGAEEFVGNLKVKKPFWFNDGKAPVVNTGSEGERKVKEMTAADILKLQKEKPDEYKAAMAKRLKRA